MDNFKKSTKSITKHCNFKRFHVLGNALQNFTFFLHKFISKQFFILPTKILNNARTPTEIKQNQLH